MSELKQITEHKAEIVKNYGSSPKNTGTPEVQVALITDRINELNIHFKEHKKDHHSRRGLLRLVGQRKRLLGYLRKKSEARYVAVIQSLKLRK